MEPAAGPDKSIGTSLLWFHATGRVVAKKYGRWYRCYGADDQVRLTAQAFRNATPLTVYASGDDTQPELVLKLRASFPLTGKIDVREAGTDALVGVVTRSRKFLDAEERVIGQFHDARSWKEHMGEFLIDAAGQIIFGGNDGQSATTSDRYILTLGTRTVGSLACEQLPFFPDPRREPRFPRVARLLQQILPRRLGQGLLGTTPPLGWRLEVREPSAVPDWRLLACAALMTIELRNW